VECSFGEVIDKITILKIKLEHVKDKEQRKNITKEYELLQNWLKINDSGFDALFNDLYLVNKKLWNLEDSIREKSRRKSFDSSYIDCAEQIHITNDERYLIKSKLNSVYDSDLKEEKLYVKPIIKITQDLVITRQDSFELDKAIQLNYDGDFTTSYSIIARLCEKYQDAAPSDVIINLFFCMQKACDLLGYSNQYQDKLHNFIRILDTVIVNNEPMTNSLKIQYGHFLLKNRNYVDSKEYVKYMNTVVATGPIPRIHYDEMSYFKKGDVGKTLLIYTSGGLGDKIMFARFIRKVCETNSANKVIFLVDDCLHWIYQNAYRDIPNIQLVKFSERIHLPYYHYHTNITMLMFCLGLTYETIYIDYYLCNLPTTRISLENIIDSSKMNVVINWHGNYQNASERFNRGMCLEQMIPLFECEQLSHIRWISVQKEVSQPESAILAKYNVTNLFNSIDNSGNAFKDTLTILKQVELVISTDTSLLHVAATANIRCWGLLSFDPDWRWLPETTCAWYPKMKMIRQKKIGQWGSVINTVKKALCAIQTNRMSKSDPEVKVEI